MENKWKIQVKEGDTVFVEDKVSGNDNAMAVFFSNKRKFFQEQIQFRK